MAESYLNKRVLQYFFNRLKVIFASKEEIPTKTSDITNDSGFITKTVDDLTNYTDTTTLNNALDLKQDTLTVQEYSYNDFTYNTIY